MHERKTNCLLSSEVSRLSSITGSGSEAQRHAREVLRGQNVPTPPLDYPIDPETATPDMQYAYVAWAKEELQRWPRSHFGTAGSGLHIVCVCVCIHHGADKRADSGVHVCASRGATWWWR